MTDPLLAGDRAPDPRTLLDLLEATARRHPDAPAIDDGSWVLTYRSLLAEARSRARELAGLGLGPGDRVGVRATSGRADLYLSILGVLAAGCAYVPVDRDDPDERADLVFSEAGAAAVVEDEGIVQLVERDAAPLRRPGVDDDAWIIFTSGSTGKPKGVAVRHRNAAAFVDAEARLFLRGAPLGPRDRVLAGLSVAFDASCEEMWLAWRHGACLVPAPRSLVRTGMDLGPWLAERRITVVSTVPTLAGLLPPESLARVRLLIFGGEACPPELAARLAVPGREVWNTYGPTEATVVACAAQLDGQGPVRIGLPLDGWDLAVVGLDGRQVGPGETGELYIGGAGLARYLDPDLDAVRYAPAPALGWDRAYRSGDLVVRDDAGLLFVGRADDQVKVGGRRIELGEIDAALLALDGVVAAAAAVRRTESGAGVLVGYVVPDGRTPDRPESGSPAVDTPAVDTPAVDTFDNRRALESLRRTLPAALVPLLAVVEEIPTRTSGKVDRDALPWPLPVSSTPGASDPAVADETRLGPTEREVAQVWGRILGVAPTSPDDDFFELGGGSLTAAQVVSALRARLPSLTVAELYDNPSVGDLALHLDQHAPAAAPGDARLGPARSSARVPAPVGRSAQAVQLATLLAVRTLAGLRWLTWLAAINSFVATALATTTHLGWVRPVSWWWVAAGWVVLISPPGRMVVSALGARALLRGVRPGDHPRAGSVHLRIWAAEQLVGATGAVTTAGAPLVAVYARMLGAKIGRGVDLHSLPPVTGMLTLGHGCAVEPEVDLSGYWVDGDVVHVGQVVVGPDATVGARSTLLPGSRVGAGADVAAGSAVWGEIGGREYWAGSPAVRLRADVKHPWPDERPPRSRGWSLCYGVSGLGLSLMPVVSVAVGLWVVLLGTGWLGDLGSLGASADASLDVGEVAAELALWIPVGVLVAFAVHALLVVGVVRGLGAAITEGYHPAESRAGWAAWATERVMDQARTTLFPLYSSVATPAWLRLLGARVGHDVEASTVVGIPSMMDVAHGAFLADDTMVASYELGGGWVRIARARVGKRAFLGNSGITAPGRSVPKNGLVAVLSAAPSRAKAGSSWLGSPPTRLRRVVQSDVDEGLTFAPPRHLVVARGVVEACRLAAPIVAGYLAAAALVTLQWLVTTSGWGWAALLGGLVLLVVGCLGAALTAGAKWALVGRVRTADHPLWSGFVWRGELADTFTEMVAAPWLADHAAGTPLLTAWLRTMGARIGRGVWCETYWLPEADLVTLADGATVGRGCVVQTHLFHDRVMSLDTVVLELGASFGPHGVVLPAARLEAGARVGAGSLVMRGEVVPSGSAWRGNPIGPWVV